MFNFFSKQNFPVLIEDKFAKDINNLALNFRNPAAHEKSLNKEDNIEVRSKIIELLNNLLSKRLIIA